MQCHTATLKVEERLMGRTHLFLWCPQLIDGLEQKQFHTRLFRLDGIAVVLTNSLRSVSTATVTLSSCLVFQFL